MKGSQGSGFFLNTEKSTYFVTAKHVLVDDKGKPIDASLTLEAFSPDPLDDNSNIFLIDVPKVQTDGFLKLHPKEDIAVIKIGVTHWDGPNSRMETVAGVTIKQFAARGIVGLSKVNLRKFADVQISNDLYIFGFPNSIGLQQLPQLDTRRPLLRKGIVAGLNRAQKTIIIDCEVFPGNSGGLALQVEPDVLQVYYRAIGVVVQFVPFDNTRIGAPSPTILNSGYSVVTPMDAVLELTTE